MAHDSLRFLHLNEKDLVQLSSYCDILNKDLGCSTYISYMLSRTNEMFVYDNLPSTIPAKIFELMLQSYGSLGILSLTSSDTFNEPGIYAIRGNAGGPQDAYYQHTIFVTANPALMPKSYNYRIVNHYPPYDRSEWSNLPPCVYVRNDINCNGLLPLFSRYATQMVENDISIRSAQINSRQQTLIAASTGSEIESANQYLKDLEAGKLAAVATTPFIEGLSTTNVSTMASNAVIQLIELQQYLKASWYNELGLNSSFNMKREYLSAEEIKASTDVLLPLVDDMFSCRQQAIEAVNKEFGTKISVSKNSAWLNKQEESDIHNEEKDPDEPDNSTSTNSEETEDKKDAESN